MRLDLRSAAEAARERWIELWFQEWETTPLEVLRIGLGFLLSFNYGLLPPADVLAFYGPHGLLAPEVVPEAGRWLTFSLFYFLQQDVLVLAVHYLFVALCVCLCVGFRTRWTKWLVFVLYLSYMNRIALTRYGVDHVLSPFLFLLCLAPIGGTLSFDRARAVRRFEKERGPGARPPVPLSARACACQRLMQLQVAVIYFYSGAEKLRGSTWWGGDAPWFALVDNEVAFAPWALGVLAEHFWIVNLMAFGTVVIELGYPFLIWGRRTRPYLLGLAILLHVHMALLMGLYFFAATMIFAHLSFARPEWYAQLGRWMRARRSGPPAIAPASG